MSHRRWRCGRTPSRFPAPGLCGSRVSRLRCTKDRLEHSGRGKERNGWRFIAGRIRDPVCRRFGESTVSRGRWVDGRLARTARPCRVDVRSPSCPCSSSGWVRAGEVAVVQAMGPEAPPPAGGWAAAGGWPQGEGRASVRSSRARAALRLPELSRHQPRQQGHQCQEEQRKARARARERPSTATASGVHLAGL